MASATGPVSCVLVGGDFGLTSIMNRASGRKEAYVLWYLPGGIPVEDRLRLSMWVAMLRDAITRGIDVTVTHYDDSARVLNLQLGSF